MVCSNMTRPHQLLLILFLLTLLSRVTFTSDVIRTLSGDYPVKPLTLAYHCQPVRPAEAAGLRAGDEVLAIDGRTPRFSSKAAIFYCSIPTAWARPKIPPRMSGARTP